MLQHIIIKENILDAPIYEYLFTVAEGKTNGQLSPADLNHISIGSLGNLCNGHIHQKMQDAAEFHDNVICS
jgi:hypothetical protein